MYIKKGKPMNYAKSILLLFTLTASILYAENKSEEVSFGKNKFFPINPKLNLIYDSSFGEVTNSITVVNDTIHIINEAEDFYYAQKMLLKNDSLMIIETHQKFSVLLFINRENKIFYQEPLLRIPFPLDMNSEWQSSTSQYSGKYKSKVSMSGSLIKKEKINTKIGSFDTIKLTTTVKTDYGSENVITEWYAENIGLVKAEIEVKGGGFTGFLRDLLGYDLLTFEISDIKYNSK
jgi:hypothetical protein